VAWTLARATASTGLPKSSSTQTHTHEPVSLKGRLPSQQRPSNPSAKNSRHRHRQYLNHARI
jgi:hypothetical protein